MKKILLKTISLLMMALAPLAMPAVNTIIHTVTYDFSQMSTGTDTLGGVTYTTVNYAGLYNDGAPGTPSLPVDYLRFSTTKTVHCVSAIFLTPMICRSLTTITTQYQNQR